MRTAKDLEVLRVKLLIAPHRIEKARVAHDITADVARAQKTAGLAQIQSMLSNDRPSVVLRRMERDDDAPALGAANSLIAQIFEQRLAVDQPKCRLFEQGGLRTPEAGVRDLSHESR